MNQNPTSNTVWERQLEWFKTSSQYRFLDHWRRADGIRVEYIPRIHHIAALQQSPWVHVYNWRSTTIQRTNYLHVDVQWHLMEIWRQCEQECDANATLVFFLQKDSHQDVAREMGSPRQAFNRRRRTREGPEPACVQHLGGEWHRRGAKDELTSCRGPSSRRGKHLQWDAKEEEPGCPKRASGRHVVRRRQSSPILEVRPGNRQGWWKRSTFRWNGRQLTLDKTVSSRVWWHTQGSNGRPASNLGWGSSSKTAPGSLSTGSPAGRTPPHGDGSMYSQANVRAGKVLRPLSERCRPWS